MKQDEGTGRGRSRSRLESPLLPEPRPSPGPFVRPAAARVVIRPARPDDLEEATLLERRIWGRLAVTLNELQRRLFALPESFLLAELQRPGRLPQIVGMANGLLWTRDFPRSYLEYEKMLPSSSHNPRGDVLYLASIGIDEPLRSRGIGLRLVQEAVEVGRRRHLKLTRLIANTRSRPLCARVGFEVVRPLPRLFRQHRDLMPQPVLMELPLI
ncbi:MAG TPA: GNAT family N-acetyltransferase [Candidatus Polarisedimenticolia bacterium]|nr:GNAT family N-acetyltransferase [Candidatus Polarisedimenticolia bacterium]